MSLKKISFLFMIFSIAAAISIPARSQTTPINGACSSPSIQYECASGTPENQQVSGTTATWTCDGINNGTNSITCTSPYTPQTAVAGSCGGTADTCAVGTVSGITTQSSIAQWQCQGFFGGATATCQVAISSVVQPPEPITTLGLSGVAVKSNADSNGLYYPLTIGAGDSALGLTVYPQTTYTAAQGGATTMPGQVVVEEPLILRASDDSPDCNAALNVGAIRFNPTTRIFEGCNGTSWQPLGGSSTKTVYFSFNTCSLGGNDSECVGQYYLSQLVPAQAPNDTNYQIICTIEDIDSYNNGGLPSLFLSIDKKDPSGFFQYRLYMTKDNGNHGNQDPHTADCLYHHS